MKFLCDRCKTRYSIGDDRVRGKILKIRCKNCANVITVREGMNADDPASDRNRATTAAPIGNTAPANGALASAFASQLTKPPPALEEEWYVSIDGDQSGPFSLTEAQSWIAGKAFDADVHCWSEGFDDWLPVDKVSHFRGLRKKPAPPMAPPPLPRVAPNRSGPAAALQQTRPEDLSEPKPLFASTMASLEKAAGLPPSPQTPPLGILAKANGTGSAPVPRVPDNGRAKSPAIPSTITVNKNGSGPNHNSVQGPSAGAKALAAAFDASDSSSDAAPGFPVAVEVDKKPALAAVPEPESNGAPEPPEDDDGLDIGEVSRVVKLADLMKAGNAPRRSSRAPVANMRATGSTPKIEAAALGVSLGAADAVPVIATPEVVEPAVAAPVVAQAHRRGLIMLIGVAAVLLAGVVVLLVVMMNKTDDNTNGGLGSTHTIDTSRPEELVLRELPHEGSAQVQKPLVPIIRHPINTPHPNGSGSDDGEAKGDKLKPDDIEDMARKQSAGTQRCYMRAQRGAEGIEIADLKKLSVTLTIDKTGTVSDVVLSEHGADMLGQCLSSQIKRWKFRESPGGQYRIILAFAS